MRVGNGRCVRAAASPTLCSLSRMQAADPSSPSPSPSPSPLSLNIFSFPQPVLSVLAIAIRSCQPYLVEQCDERLCRLIRVIRVINDMILGLLGLLGLSAVPLRDRSKLTSPRDRQTYRHPHTLQARPPVWPAHTAPSPSRCSTPDTASGRRRDHRRH
jgi:hypothetical protein